MTRIMLIDAEEQEETRVVIMNDGDIDHFDFISKSKSQIKGNIYLAKITRIEPSLQAAFVEYGGDKQGFLSFSEIHPDYYQIPVEDREQLLREAAAFADAEDEENEENEQENDALAQPASLDEALSEASTSDDEASPTKSKRIPRKRGRRKIGGVSSIAEPNDESTSSTSDDDGSTLALAHEHDIIAEESVDRDDDADDDAQPSDTSNDTSDDATEQDADAGDGTAKTPRRKRSRRGGKNRGKQRTPEQTSSDEEASPTNDAVSSERGDEPMSVSLDDDDDDHEERGTRRTPSMRRYKIQEVLRPGQIVLVQVVKEERGNKGASLSTYISLAGRYCVLMPNSPRGGGVSRKIGSGEDRKRLREIVADLNVARGMSAIIRTAGMDRTRAEIKRDYEYLIKLWNQVREDAIASIAPHTVYEESDIVKRSIRDHYNGDIDAIWIQGEAAYKRAKEFMKLLMPSHAPRVKQFKASEPLFTAYGIERLLSELYHTSAPLKSGGYIVINPTEALISIDVNSGRSTTEKNVEETAYKTNLEACDEIARQLRLRNLGGLVVIDFIDMGYHKYRRHVERALREAFKQDRAKIQIGFISPFGLLEMSRQRMGASIIESTTQTCPTCNGTGRIPLIEATVMQMIRQLQSFLAEHGDGQVIVSLSHAVMLELLNQHRAMLQHMEQMYQVTLTFEIHQKEDNNYYQFKGKQNLRFASDDLLISKKHAASGKKDKGRNKKGKQRHINDLANIEPEPSDEPLEDEIHGEASAVSEEQNEQEPRKRSRSRRNRRNRNKDDRNESSSQSSDTNEHEHDIAEIDEVTQEAPLEAPASYAPQDDASSNATHSPSPVNEKPAPEDTPPPSQPRRGWWGRILEG